MPKYQSNNFVIHRDGKIEKAMSVHVNLEADSWLTKLETPNTNRKVDKMSFDDTDVRDYVHQIVLENLNHLGYFSGNVPAIDPRENEFVYSAGWASSQSMRNELDWTLIKSYGEEKYQVAWLSWELDAGTKHWRQLIDNLRVDGLYAFVNAEKIMRNDEMHKDDKTWENIDISGYYIANLFIVPSLSSIII